MSDSPTTHVIVDMSASMGHHHNELVDALKVVEDNASQTGDDVRIAGCLRTQSFGGGDSELVLCEGVEAMRNNNRAGVDAFSEVLEAESFNEGDTIMIITDGFIDATDKMIPVVKTLRESDVDVQGIVIIDSPSRISNWRTIRQMESVFGRDGTDGFRIVDSATEAVQMSSAVIVTKDLNKPDLNDPRLPKLPDPKKTVEAPQHNHGEPSL